jgi:hypothetical protein
MPLKDRTERDGKPCRKAMRKMTSKLARMRCIELDVCPDCGMDLVPEHGIGGRSTTPTGRTTSAYKRCHACSSLFRA